MSLEETMDGQSQQWDKLFAALAKAQAKIEGASKDKRNPAFNSKYADLASVWEACRSALTEQGLCVIQQPLSDGDRVGLKTTLGHSSGQWMASTVWTTPKDKTPQALGSCLTYLRRYSLAAAVGVTPDEDDDGNAASGRGADPKARTAGGNAAPAPQQAEPVKANTIKHDGNLITPAQLQKLHVTRKQAGGRWCGDDEDQKSEWRMKVLGVYRDPDGNRITSSKQLSRDQASHLIDRLTDYIARTTDVNERRTQQAVEDLGQVVAQPPADILSLEMKRKGVAEADLREYVLAPYGADSVEDLDEADKAGALALLLAYTQGLEPYVATMQKLGFRTEGLV